MGNLTHVELPLPEDDIEEINRKLSIFHKLIRSKKPLAAAIGHPVVAEGSSAAEAQAYKNMTSHEETMYKMWKAGKISLEKLPKIDWKTCRCDAPTSGKPLRMAKRRAEALNRLYDTDKAEAGHSVWFVREHLRFLPLVKVIARVIGAERNLEGGHLRAKPESLVELQTLSAIIKGSAAKIQTARKSRFQAEANMYLMALIEARRKIRVQLDTSSSNVPKGTSETPLIGLLRSFDDLYSDIELEILGDIA